MDYHELEKTTVSRLREMLKEKDPDYKGASGLKKDELVAVVAGKLGVVKPHKVVTGVDKGSIKAALKKAKATRDAAIAAGDRPALRASRKELHRLRRQLRKATRLAA